MKGTEDNSYVVDDWNLIEVQKQAAFNMTSVIRVLVYLKSCLVLS
jgi:hypothetical protein